MRAIADRLGVGPYFLLGLIAMGTSAAIVWFTYTGTLRSLFNGGKPEITAVFSDAKTLQEGNPVRVNGVTVGEVKELEPVDGSRAVKATLTIDDSAGTIYRDARAKVAWRTLLGGAFAVNITPGRPESGELGDRAIPLAQTESQVELDDITSVIQGDARDGLKTIPPQLSETMEDPATLERLGIALKDVTPDAEQGLNALRGRFKDRDLKALVTQTAKAARALDAPNDELRTLVEGAAGTLQVTAAREADLRATISRAPAILRETNTTLARLDTTLGIAEPVVEKLSKPAGDVAPTLRKLSPVVTGADELLADAVPLLNRLRPASTALASTARQGLPLLDDLQPSLDRIDDKILPYMNEVDPQTQHTAAQMVGPALGGLGNVAAPFDANGHVLRFPAAALNSSAYLPCQTYVGNPDKTRLVECRNLQEIIDTYMKWDPLGPVPGTAEDPEGGR